jgi:hypothetical protein
MIVSQQEKINKNNMELLLKRIARKPTYTIGKLYVNNVYTCDVLEDYDRIYYGGSKVAGKTAIPCGRYEVVLNNYSPRFGNKEPYKSLCGGCVPLINNVPKFSGVRIHIGNTENDTDGCLLVGKNTVVGRVTDSKVTFAALMNKHLTPARKRNENVYITIK